MKAPPLTTVLFNKPMGFVSGHTPPLLPYRGLPPCGRLDKASHGLLVMSNDPDIAALLTSPKHSLSKEYIVEYTGDIEPKIAALRCGILSLDGVRLLPVTVDIIRNGCVRMELRQGRKHQIRRMLKLIGCEVTDLQRTRVGSIELGGLEIGKWRYLKSNESFT